MVDREKTNMALRIIDGEKKMINPWFLTLKSYHINRRRVLEGNLCADCEFFKLSIKNSGKGRKKEVQMSCSAGHSPVDIYQSTSYIEVPKCPDFTPEK